MTHRQEIFVAFGSNLPLNGEQPIDIVFSAIARLERAGLVLKAKSSFYSTPCFPKGAGPDYVNAACSFYTQRPIAEVLPLLHMVELEYGRERTFRWAGRTLDLDLLGCDQMVLPNVGVWLRWQSLPLNEQIKSAPEELILPHPRIQDRSFVLVPLCDVAGDWIHPVLGKSMLQLRDELPKEAIKEVVPLQ